MIRTRFAPSPTGYMHIGNLRTALYAYLIARHSGGIFILRIEDTDRKRNVPKAVQVIYDSLKLAGLEYDEGPDKDGGGGPYVQSQRLPIYRQHAEYLLEGGFAYRCFCLGKGLPQAGRQKEQQGPDPCRFLSRSEWEARLQAGEPYVIRQRIPEEGTTVVFDHVFGEIAVRNDTLDDQVLVKSDGFPTYNFANVVDDHLMGITHVVRGVEYLSSVPKYNLLYNSFQWDIPEYVHLPHIVKEGGKKLSKRAGDASFQDLIARGYLPAAIVNYIALLGWNPGTEQEIFTLEELAKEFSIDRVSKSSAAFTLAKLDWLNNQHIRSLPGEAFHALARDYYPQEVAGALDTAKISRLLQNRITRLADIPGLVAFLTAVQPYDLELYNNSGAKSTIETSRHLLAQVYPLLRDLPEWTGTALYERLKGFAEGAGLKVKTIMWPLGVALSGLAVTPGGATEIAEILGKERALARVSAALACLGAST